MQSSTLSFTIEADSHIVFNFNLKKNKNLREASCIGAGLSSARSTTIFMEPNNRFWGLEPGLRRPRPGRVHDEG